MYILLSEFTCSAILWAWNIDISWISAAVKLLRNSPIEFWKISVRVHATSELANTMFLTLSWDCVLWTPKWVPKWLTNLLAVSTLSLWFDFSKYSTFAGELSLVKNGSFSLDKCVGVCSFDFSAISNTDVEGWFSTLCICYLISEVLNSKGVLFFTESFIIFEPDACSSSLIFNCVWLFLLSLFSLKQEISLSLGAELAALALRVAASSISLPSTFLNLSFYSMSDVEMWWRYCYILWDYDKAESV